MTPGSVRALLPRLNVKNTHFLLLLPLVAGTLVLATACGDNGTTSAPLPLYVLPPVDGSTVFMLDAGKDGPVSDGTAADAPIDATHADAPRTDATQTTDAAHETSTTNDAHADVAHPADTGADVATVDASDAAQTTSDASDASQVDAATSTCSVEAGTCAPVCMGTVATLGWYLGGTLLCTDACTGLVPKCEHVGQPQQGWYTSTGNGCPPFSTEIVKDATCTP